jgi:polysaccharide biosynthesis transport protein
MTDTSTSSANESSRLDLQRRLRVWRRHRALIVFTTLAVAGMALGLSLISEKQYEASASLLFRDPGLDQTLFGASYLAPSTDPAREAATNVKLVSLEAISRRTARALQQPPLDGRYRRMLGDRAPLTEKDIERLATVAPEGQSDVVSITFLDTSPRVAALVANTFANEYIAFRRDADRAKVQEAKRLVESQISSLSPRALRGEQGESLMRRGDQLAILETLQTGNAEVVQPARIPTEAASPNPVRNTILGLILGAMLGFALAWLRERMDRRLREPQELEELFDRPTLGTIPETGRLTRRRQGRLAPAEAEAYRLLRANLRYFNVNREIRSVLLTSAAAGEGKTTVSWNLAAVAAESGSKVLLIETDLRRPTMAKRFSELTPFPGLTNLLATGGALDDVVQTVSVEETVGASAVGRTVDVIVAGPLPPNPTDLIASDRMEALIRSAEERYDLVVVDTPPTSVVSDAIPLIKEVSGVIVVSRVGVSMRDAVSRLNRQLRNLNAPLLGVVVNGLKDPSATYGYGYGYSPEYAVTADGDEFRRLLEETDPTSANGTDERGDDDEDRDDDDTRPRRRGLLTKRR